MKKLIFGCALVLVIVGCTTTSQRNVYNTIFSVEQTATLGVDDYFTLVIKGTVTTNGVPVVAKGFNDFQVAAKLATDADMAGTNGLAPASLIIEATDLGNLIMTVEQSTKK